jgi:hypothetical protein
LDLAALAAACASVVIGLQAMLFAIFTSLYASNEGFLPQSTSIGRFLRSWTLERGLLAGATIGLTGLVGLTAAFFRWSPWNDPDPRAPVLRLLLPALTALIMSCQLVFAAFFISILGVRHSVHSLGEEGPSVEDLEAQLHELNQPRLIGDAVLEPHSVIEPPTRKVGA